MKIRNSTLVFMFESGLIGDFKGPYSVLIWQSHKSGPNVILYTWNKQVKLYNRVNMNLE